MPGQRSVALTFGAGAMVPTSFLLGLLCRRLFLDDFPKSRGSARVKISIAAINYRDLVASDRQQNCALAKLYGQAELLGAVSQALGLATYDAAYVENLLLAERRRRQLPTPTLPTPKRRELIDEIQLEPADPALYDRFCKRTDEDSHGTT